MKKIFENAFKATSDRNVPNIYQKFKKYRVVKMHPW